MPKMGSQLLWLLLIVIVMGVSSINAAENKEHTIIACEGEELVITCEAGNLIDLISANYGRLSKYICQRNVHDTTITNCKNSTTFKELLKRCSGKVSCNVAASNGIFGDPCGGIHKYLEVHYICEPPSTISHGNFLTKFDKIYENEKVAQYRASIYHANVKVMEEHNKLYHSGKSTFMMGVNKYSDLTHEEVISQLTGDQEPESSGRSKRAATDRYIPTDMGKEPLSLDYRKGGALNPIRHQGLNCGSDWALSAIGSIESHIFQKFRKLVQLSEQYVIDCGKGVAFPDHHDDGCDPRGGSPNGAIEYSINNGIILRDEYPYTGKGGTCNESATTSKYIVTGIQRINPRNDQELMNALVNRGAVSVSIFVSGNFVHHKSGIYMDDKGCTDKSIPNHAVVLVGYGEEGGHPYWLIRNSWGAVNGENGYIKLSRKKNNYCQISLRAYIPIVRLPGVTP